MNVGFYNIVYYISRQYMEKIVRQMDSKRDKQTDTQIDRQIDRKIDRFELSKGERSHQDFIEEE